MYVPLILLSLIIIVGRIPSLINILANLPMVVFGLWVCDGFFMIHNMGSKSKRFCIHLYVLTPFDVWQEYVIGVLFVVYVRETFSTV